MRSEIDMTLELSSRVVMLRLTGDIDHLDIHAGARVLLTLPPAIGTLRIDARQLDSLTEPAGMALRLLIKQWRQVRRGAVDILADAPALALLADRKIPVTPLEAVPLTAPSPTDAALTGVFL